MVGFNCHESYKDDTFNASLEKAKLDCWNISLSQPYPNDGKWLRLLALSSSEHT